MNRYMTIKTPYTSRSFQLFADTTDSQALHTYLCSHTTPNNYTASFSNRRPRTYRDEFVSANRIWG